MEKAATNKLSLRKNDQVQVISGREKGKTGKILKVDAKNMRITIEKINMVKKHMKPSQQSPQGGIIEKELPLHYSNILLMCPKCNRGVRHGFKPADQTATKSTKSAKSDKTASKNTKASKVRVCKRCGESLEAA
jgi:large subunit ribosomal protein L24